MAQPLFDDESYEAWEMSIRRHPILGDEFSKMEALGQRLEQHPITGARDPRNWYGRHYQTVFGPSRYSAEQVYRQFMISAARCRFEDVHLVKEFLQPIRRHLRGESRVMNTYDPIDLLNVWSVSAAADLISRQARVEALVRFVMARRLVHIDEIDSEIDVGGQESRIIRDLTERLFVEGESRDLLIRAILSRAKGYQIASWRFVTSEADPYTPEETEVAVGMAAAPPGESPFIFKHERVPSRVAVINGSERRYLIDDRVKSDYSTGQKEIRKGRPMSEEIDKCGIHLVAYDEEALGELQAKIEKELQKPPFRIRRMIENLTRDEPLKVGNGSSNSEFKAIRYELEYDDSRATGVMRPLELNLRRVVDFLNDAVSLSTGRHEVYRYRQLRLAYFPFRFPRFLHGIDWREGSDHDRRVLLHLDTVRLSAISASSRIILPDR